MNLMDKVVLGTAGWGADYPPGQTVTENEADKIFSYFTD